MSLITELADAQRAWKLAPDDEHRAAAAADIRAAMVLSGHQRATVVDIDVPGGSRLITVIWGVDGSAFT